MQPTGHYKQVEPHLAGSLAPGTRAMGGAKRRVEGVGWGGLGVTRQEALLARSNNLSWKCDFSRWHRSGEVEK